MIRLLADENFDQDLVRGVLRRRPGFDVVRAQDVGLLEAADPAVLVWAAREQRIVISHDVKTMIGFARERISRGEPMAGLFVVHLVGMVPSKIIDDLLLLDDCSETGEWASQVVYLPLR
jgi:predicted nuclease of predicted toxin-antitoxin system